MELHTNLRHPLVMCLQRSKNNRVHSLEEVTREEAQVPDTIQLQAQQQLHKVQVW